MRKPTVSRTVLSLVLAAAGMVLPPALSGQSYFMIMGGNLGALHHGSFGVEAGKFFPKKDPRFFWGGDFSSIEGGFGEYIRGPNGTRIPDENEIGADVGIRVLRGLYLVGTGGVSWHDEEEFAPDDESFFFGQGTLIAKKRKVYASGSGQLRFVFNVFGKGLILGAGYHSRRGFVVGLGFTFSGLLHKRRAAAPEP